MGSISTGFEELLHSFHVSKVLSIIRSVEATCPYVQELFFEKHNTVTASIFSLIDRKNHGKAAWWLSGKLLRQQESKIYAEKGICVFCKSHRSLVVLFANDYY
jgi:hypothetical protein